MLGGNVAESVESNRYVLQMYRASSKSSSTTIKVHFVQIRFYEIIKTLSCSLEITARHHGT